LAANASVQRPRYPIILIRRILPLLILLLLPIASLHARQNFEGVPHIWQVFLQRDVETGGADRITFVDLLTAEQTALVVDGERYTLMRGSVLYLDRITRRVMLAFPDGDSREHPFIQPDAQTRRVDWLLSADAKMIAWTLTGGTSENLTTRTSVANLDGSNLHEVFLDGPRNAIRAMPVAFSTDNTHLYMDFQPDGFSDFAPYPQFAGLFTISMDGSGTWEYLPDEPACFCGAGFGSGLMLRLKVSADLSGFDLNVYNLTGQVEQTILAQPIRNYTQAGNIILSPDGSRAVYALAQIQNFGRADQSVQTVFMLVDLQRMTQRALTEPITTFVEPVTWTEDNTAIIFTSRQRDGTWKINLADGALVRVADATFLGTAG